MIQPVHLGILAGLRSEARCLSANLPPAGQLAVSIELSGASLSGACLAVDKLIEAGATHLLSFGLAGGLAPVHAPGTLLLPDEVTTLAGERYPVDADWRGRVRVLLAPLAPEGGIILGSDAAVTSAADKALLHAAHDAIAVDMESHVVAAATTARGLPFLVLRVVADAADTGLPPAALAAVTPAGATDLIAVLRSVLGQPRQIPALIRLGRAAAAADRTLLRCCRRGLRTGLGVR